MGAEQERTAADVGHDRQPTEPSENVLAAGLIGLEQARPARPQEKHSDLLQVIDEEVTVRELYLACRWSFRDIPWRGWDQGSIRSALHDLKTLGLVDRRERPRTGRAEARHVWFRTSAGDRVAANLPFTTAVVAMALELAVQAGMIDRPEPGVYVKRGNT